MRRLAVAIGVACTLGLSSFGCVSDDQVATGVRELVDATGDAVDASPDGAAARLAAAEATWDEVGPEVLAARPRLHDEIDENLGMLRAAVRVGDESVARDCALRIATLADAFLGADP